MPLNVVAPVEGVDEKENPVVAASEAVVTTTAVLNALVVFEATVESEGIPNFI